MRVVKNETSTMNENTPSIETRLPSDEVDHRRTNVSSLEKNVPALLNELDKDDTVQKNQTRGDNSNDKKQTRETKLNISVSEMKQVIHHEAKVDEGNLAIQLIRCKIKDESDENIRHLKSSKKLNVASLEDDLSKLSINETRDKHPEVRLVAKGPDGGHPVYQIKDNLARHELTGVAHKAMPCMSYGTAYPSYDDRANNFSLGAGKRGRDTDRVPAYKYTRPGMAFENSSDSNLMPLRNDMSSFPSPLYQEFPRHQLSQQHPQQQFAQQCHPQQQLPRQQHLQRQLPQPQLPPQQLPQTFVYPDNMNNLNVTTCMSQQQSPLVSMPTMSVNNMCGGMVTMKSQTHFENGQSSFVSVPNVLYQQRPQPVDDIPDLDYNPVITEGLDEIMEMLSPPKMPPVSVAHGHLLPESVQAQNIQRSPLSNSPDGSVDRFTGELLDNRQVASATTLTNDIVTDPGRHLSGEDSGFETASDECRSDFSPESQFSPESYHDSPPSVTLMSPASVGSAMGMGSPQMPELISQRSVQTTVVPGKIQQRVESEPTIPSYQLDHGSPISYTSADSPMAPHSCPPPYPNHRSPYSAVRSPMSVQSVDMRSPNSSNISVQDSNPGSVPSLDQSPAGQLNIDAVPSPQQSFPSQQLPQQRGGHVVMPQTNLTDKANRQVSDADIIFDNTSVKLMDDFLADHRVDFLDVMHVLADDLLQTQRKTGCDLSSNSIDPNFNIKQDIPPMLVSNLTSACPSIPAIANGPPPCPSVVMAQAASPQTQCPVSPVSVVMPPGTLVHGQPVIIGGQNLGGAMMMAQPGNTPIMVQQIPPGTHTGPIPANMMPVQSGNNQTVLYAMPVFHPEQYPRKGIVAKKPLRKILPKMFDVKDSVSEQSLANMSKGKPGPKSKNAKSLMKMLPTTLKDHISGINMFDSSMVTTSQNAAPGLPLTSGQKMSSVAAPGGPPMGPLLLSMPSIPAIEDPCKKLNLARRCVANMTTDDLDFQDEDGDSYLHVGVCRNDPHLVQALVERVRRCNLNRLIDVQNAKRQTPLYLAVAVNHPAIVKMFVHCGADPNSLAQVSRNDCEGMEVKAAIHYASSGGMKYLETLRELLKSPYINLNLANSEGLTALHCAIRSHGHLKKDSCRINAIPIVELLIKSGCDSNVQDKKSGKTPLMYAIESRDSHLVTLMFTLIKKPQLRQMLKTQTFDGSSCAKIASRLRGDTNPEGWQKITTLILSVGTSENSSSQSLNNRKHNVIAVS